MLTYQKSKLVILLMFFAIQLPSRAEAKANVNNIRFDHISLEHGLSQSSVLAIIQDKYGFMWFATQDGLNKYDGYDFTVYRNDPKVAGTISGNHIVALYEDKNGILWAGTNGAGLNRYDAGRETFEHYKHDGSDPKSLSDNRVTCICEDGFGEFWIGTEKGLNRFDRTAKIFTRYQHDPTVQNTLSNDNITSIYEDEKEILWIGTKNGLGRYDRVNDNFINYKHNPADPKSISNNAVWSICGDGGGNLWICTWGGGLNKLDGNTGTFDRYLNDPENPDNSISGNHATRVFQDRDGILWVGTKSGGLNRFDPSTESFRHYRRNPQDRSGLSHNYVSAIHEDGSGVIWIGTLAGGLNKFKKTALRNSIEHYTHMPDNPKSLSNEKVWSIIEDKKGTVWIGTDNGVDKFDPSSRNFTHCLKFLTDSVRAIHEDKNGVLWFGTLSRGVTRYDPDTGTITQLKHDPGKPGSLSDNTVISVYEDSMDTLWFGTWDGGLNRYDRTSGVFGHFKNDADNPRSLSNNIVRCIYEDDRNMLWIGTNDGLNRFDRTDDSFEVYKNRIGDPNSLSNNVIRCLHQSPNGPLWIGTNGGLNRFDKATQKFAAYRESDGLANDTIYGILENGRGCLWLSTNKGLSSFDPESKTFRNYDFRDGLQSNEFNAGAYHAGKNGKFYFGGISGFNVFHPDATKRDGKYVPAVVLTKFQKFYRDVLFDKPIQDIGEIVLPRTDNIFSFNFTTTDYAEPGKNRYKYKLENFDREWINAKTRRFATYTNLDPGRYVFKVKGSNGDGIWSEEISTSIVIVPSWWQTWWFKTFAAAIVCLFAYAVAVFYRTREQFNNIAFMGGYIAHEINSPLASLRITCDLLSKIATGKDTRISAIAQKIKTDVVQINEGVNTFRDLDPIYVRGAKKEYSYESVDILSLTNEYVESVREGINPQEIDLNVDSAGSTAARLDPMDFRVILKNLLANAIHAVKIKEKAPDYKRKIAIGLKCDAEKNVLIFEVRDNGAGMDKNTLRKCRRPYFSTKYKPDRETVHSATINRVSGIGLAIVQNKIDKYKMRLEIESRENEGSCFRIFIPIGGVQT